ncbi:hypothetical protein PHYPSEUDO_014101 [Phytophthora pseudosyringae]|uniref:Cyclic nucleotide-binding domain-containing protein n=1 Tax=Phytophthora pseudosyringae TaxID=221518 RepID=A0A8T1W5M8_9STRA|nr:hypothetical protein PHYPSEUDO_014101 [Phytophthora pseudosyringae]
MELVPIVVNIRSQISLKLHCSQVSDSFPSCWVVVTTSIRTRVLHCLKFQHTYLKGLDIYATFSDLSSNLRVQLVMDLHGDTLQNLCIAPFLNKINGLAVRLKSELYIPRDTIIVEGDLGHKLYLVKGGMTINLPLQATSLVKIRDYVYIEATGILCFAKRCPCRDDFPQTKPLPNKTRGGLSIFGIFRQIDHNVIDNYASGTMSRGGEIMRFVMIPGGCRG